MVTGSRCPIALLLAIVCVAGLVARPLRQDQDQGRSMSAFTPPASASTRILESESRWRNQTLELIGARDRRTLRRRLDHLVLPPDLPLTEELAASATARAERSGNLSHIAGTGRKIMMYVRNRHLQILPDGTVNGTDDESSDFAVLQRTSVNKVQVKMQGVATCLFLCMDACGLLYGSRDLTDDCVFNELLEQHHYNTYSSSKYSGRARSLYLALDRRGAPRRVQLKPSAPQGRLAAYTRVLTKPVPGARVADLLARLRASSGSALPMTGSTHFRHRGHHAACPPHGHPESTPRRPRRCPRQRKQPQLLRRRSDGPGRVTRKKCEPSEDEDFCHKRLQMIAAKKRKSRNEERDNNNKRTLLKRRKVQKKVHNGNGAGPLWKSVFLFSSTTPASSARASPATLSHNQRPPSADDEDDDEIEDEDVDDAMTTEMTTTVSLEDVLASVSAGGGVEDP